MKTRYLKIANLLIGAGIAVLIVGIVWQFPTFYPYFATLLRGSQLETAPPLDAALVVDEAEARALLPFDEHTASGNGAGEIPTLLRPVTPTVTPTLLPPTPTLTPAAIPPTATAEPTPTRRPTSTPTSIPQPTGIAPVEIRIPDIALEAPVVPIEWETVTAADGTTQGVWLVPDWRAAGWHYTSAPLGVSGNTVLNGHNTTRGEVFRDLYRLTEDALVFVKGENHQSYVYRVEHIYILPEAGQPLNVRLENARYIQQTADERLTLVTCHPYGSTANRLVVIAYPTDIAPAQGE